MTTAKIIAIEDRNRIESYKNKLNCDAVRFLFEDFEIEIRQQGDGIAIRKVSERTTEQLSICPESTNKVILF